MDKLIVNGRVAVLYSPGFGAGWASWNSELGEYLCMDKELTEILFNAKDAKEKRAAKERIMEIVEEKYPDVYTGGGDSLELEWVDIGDRFEIAEYDGNERVRIIGKDIGYLA